MKIESSSSSYLAVPAGIGPHPGVVVVHEAFGLNDNIRDICGRLAEQGYAALGVDLFDPPTTFLMRRHSRTCRYSRAAKAV